MFLLDKSPMSISQASVTKTSHKYKDLTWLLRLQIEGHLLRWQTEFALIGWFVLKEEAELTDKEQSLVHSKS